MSTKQFDKYPEQPDAPDATPETDALVFWHHYEGQNDGPAEVVDADHARTLERQRNALRAVEKMRDEEIAHIREKAGNDSIRLEDEVEALKHDIERHVRITSEQATEIVTLQDKLAEVERDANAIQLCYSEILQATRDIAEHGHWMVGQETFCVPRGTVFHDGREETRIDRLFNVVYGAEETFAKFAALRERGKS